MLRSIKEMRGYNIVADDGEVGRVHDFLFDDQQWSICYLVASTGKWLPGRKVLVPPYVLGRPDWDGRLFPISMRKEQVEDSPPIGADEPVSGQHVNDFNEFYLANWNPAWTSAPVEGREEDPHLRSAHEVIGYRVQAEDDKIGHVDDFIVEDGSWIIQLAVIDTRNLLPGKSVLIPVGRLKSILYGESRVYVEMPKNEIENLPPYNPYAPVNRRLEEVRYDFQGRRSG